MANQIQIKRGTGVPPSLTDGELAYDKENEKLYIGTDDSDNPYCLNPSLPTASADTLGGVKIGNMLSMNNGAIGVADFSVEENDTQKLLSVFNGNSKEKVLEFDNPTDSEYYHDATIYGGNPSSYIAIGMYDKINSHRIFSYADATNEIYLGNSATKVRCGLSTDIYGDLFYKSGDTESFTQLSCGHVTSSGTEFVWYIHLPKSMKDVSVVDDGTTVQIRQNGKYLNGASSAKAPSSWTGYGASGSFTLTKMTDTSIRMVVKVTTADSNTTNNDVCSFNCNIRIKFT